MFDNNWIFEPVLIVNGVYSGNQSFRFSGLSDNLQNNYHKVRI